MRRQLTVAFGLLLLTAPLWAQVGAHMSWQNATTYMDGTVLPSSEIQETRIHFGQASGGPYSFATEVAPGSVEQHDTLPIFGDGTWFAVAAHVSTKNPMEGEISQETSFFVDRCQANPMGCRPRAPTNLTITLLP